MELSCIGNSQEVNSRGSTVGILTRDSRKSSALTSDSNIEGLVALLAKLIYRDVLSDLDSRLDLNTHLTHDIDFSVNDVFFKLVRRNSVCQHSAGKLVLLKDCRIIAHLCKVECT